MQGDSPRYRAVPWLVCMHVGRGYGLITCRISRYECIRRVSRREREKETKMESMGGVETRVDRTPCGGVADGYLGVDSDIESALKVCGADGHLGIVQGCRVAREMPNQRERSLRDREKEGWPGA